MAVGLFVDMFCCIWRWIRGEKGEDDLLPFGFGCV